MWVFKEWYDGNQKEEEISFSAYDENLNEIFMRRNCLGEIEVHKDEKVVKTFKTVSHAKKYIADLVEKLNAEK